MGAASKVIGGIAGLGGTVIAMNGQKNAAMTREEQDRDVADWSHRQAADALQRGAIAAGRAKLRGGEVAGAQAASFSASGVDSSVGTAAQVQANTQVQSGLDALTIQNNAAREAFGFERNARTANRQAAIDHDNGNDQQTATFLGGMGSLAGTGGDIAGGFGK